MERERRVGGVEQRDIGDDDRVGQIVVDAGKSGPDMERCATRHLPRDARRRPRTARHVPVPGMARGPGDLEAIVGHALERLRSERRADRRIHPGRLVAVIGSRDRERGLRAQDIHLHLGGRLGIGIDEIPVPDRLHAQADIRREHGILVIAEVTPEAGAIFAAVVTAGRHDVMNQRILARRQRQAVAVRETIVVAPFVRGPAIQRGIGAVEGAACAAEETLIGRAPYIGKIDRRRVAGVDILRQAEETARGGPVVGGDRDGVAVGKGRRRRRGGLDQLDVEFAVIVGDDVIDAIAQIRRRPGVARQIGDVEGMGRRGRRRADGGAEFGIAWIARRWKIEIQLVRLGAAVAGVALRCGARRRCAHHDESRGGRNGSKVTHKVLP